MSVEFEKAILSKLVNMYENSPAFVRGELPARRRKLRFYDNGKTNVPLYDIENHIVRKDINDAVQELSKAGFVGYRWMEGQKGHIIAAVWLKYEKLEYIYEILKREPKGHAIAEIIAGLEKLIETTEEKWIIEWAGAILQKIRKKRSIGNSLPTAVRERQDLIKALSNLGGETETLERVFSIRCFGDSKRFERTVKKRLIQIIKRHLSEEDDCSDQAAMNLVGLVRYPEQFEFSGALTLELPNGKIDYSPLPYGGIITSEDINISSLTLGPNVKHILSVENKANYIDYVRKEQTNDEFVIYHGGQYSPAKRVFLKKIAAAMPGGCSFSHWGDIDFGGFSMLARLRREIFPGVEPYKMGIPELQKYREYCASFEKKYHDRLSALLAMPELGDCADCIEYMIENRIRLEQEAMLK